MIEPTTHQIRTSDGYSIHVTRWSPETDPRASCVILHGVQSHAGWYHGLGRFLAEAGIEAHFPDRRGSGSNQEERGHCPSSGRLIEDVIEICRAVRDDRPELPVILGGISWGGKLVVTAAARQPGLIDGIALICPGLEPRVGVSRSERLRIAAAFFINRKAHFPIPLADPALFTANPDAQRFIANDPLSLRTATAGLLAASTFLDRKARRAPSRVEQPCLLMLAEHDRIVNNDRTRDYVQRLASADKTVIEYPDAHHTLEFEPEPGRYARDLVDWIEARWVPRRHAAQFATP
ncbi:alpha/beta fold hydrolase [Tautonia sp. JC769]|uniref:alpha/beta fold hydrolase n=1 Tax=Tautonia sp. JC769 TaxID=3232135 RepID=UPI00345951EF